MIYANFEFGKVKNFNKKPIKRACDAGAKNLEKSAYYLHMSKIIRNFASAKLFQL